MDEEYDDNGWLPPGTWPNESSMSVTPEPLDSEINHEAMEVWHRGNFPGLSTSPLLYPNVSQQCANGTNVQQQSYAWPFSTLPHGGNSMHHARQLAFDPSVLPVPNSWNLKRPYSSISTTPNRQQAAHTSPHGINLHVSYGLPQFPQHGQHDPSLKKQRRFAQTPNPGVRLDVLSRDEDPEVIAQRDKTGHTHGHVHIFGARQKVRRDMTASESARTKRTRKLEACGRCKALKQRCDRPACDFMPCANCLKARHSVKGRLGDALCIRVKLLDLNLHRNGTTGTTFLRDWMYRKDTLVYNSVLPLNTHRRTIQLSQGIDGIVLDVPVVQYRMESEDKTWYVWKDSRQKQCFMNMPPYYICDMESTREDLLAKMEKDTAGEYVLSLLRKDDDIVREAFCEAHRLRQRSPLLSDALNIWCGTRFTELTWTICGEDKLECTPPTETDNPWHGTVPVTPIMDTQLDEIAINAFLKPYDGQFLRELQRKMTNPDTTDWYEVLLALFIILHNFQRMFIDVIEYTTRHGMEESKSRGGTSLSERNVHACKSLLAYFHYAYLGSRRFFSVLKKSEEMESMPEEQQRFLHTLHRFMSKKDQLKEWQQRNMYHDPMFWIIQLLIPEWKGDFKLSTPIDGFTEEDLLTT